MDTFNSQFNLVSFLIVFSLKTYINVIFPCQTFMQPLPKTFPAKSQYAVFVFPQSAHKSSAPTVSFSIPIFHLKFYMHILCSNACSMLQPSHPSPFNGFNIISRKVQFMKTFCHVPCSILQHPHFLNPNTQQNPPHSQTPSLVFTSL